MNFISLWPLLLAQVTVMSLTVMSLTVIFLAADRRFFMGLFCCLHPVHDDGRRYCYYEI